MLFYYMKYVFNKIKLLWYVKEYIYKPFLFKKMVDAQFIVFQDWLEL